MTTTHTIYLTPQQTAALLPILQENEGQAFNIIQADLLGNGEYDGHIIVQVSMGVTLAHIDRKGNIVPPKQKEVANA